LIPDPNFEPDPNDPNIFEDPNLQIIEHRDDSGIAQGGGIFSFRGPMDINDCQIRFNEATTSGGGVYLGGDYDPATTVGPHLRNCLVTNNGAGRDGGGVSCNWYVQALLSNCTIADNVVLDVNGFGGGLYCSYGGDVKVVDTIIWDNISANGSQVAVGSGDLPYPLPSWVEVTHTNVRVSVEPVESADVVFCVDTTWSMRYDIDAVKDSATQIISEIAEAYPDLRLAVVDYRDFDEPSFGHGGPGDYPYHTVSEFTDGVVAAEAAINSLIVARPNTFDRPESMYCGLMHCIDHDSVYSRLHPNFYGADADSTGPGEWRSGNVEKVIIVMGDAPPHDPEPFTGFTLGDIVTAANAKRINIFSVVTGRAVGEAGTEAYFRDLAEGTGGAMLEAAVATEVVDAFMEAIALVSRPAVPVYVEEGCVLAGWEPNDPNDFYTWDVNCWDANSRNINADPNFVHGYYLSHIATGQDVDSPAIDAGSDLAGNLGMDVYTTRIDGVNDANVVDLGYHYSQGAAQYQLSVTARLNRTVAGTTKVRN
jgi:hypothetical protein